MSATPGKTRLLNFFRVVPTDGLELRFVDFPGYGYAKVAKSERGAFQRLVETYVRRRDTLRAVTVLVAARRAPGAEERMLLEWLAAAGRVPIVVMTKADKLSRHELKPAVARLRRALELDADPLPVSAESRAGRDLLWAALLAAAVAPPTAGV